MVLAVPVLSMRELVRVFHLEIYDVVEIGLWVFRGPNPKLDNTESPGRW